MILNRAKFKHDLFQAPSIRCPDKRMEIVAMNILRLLDHEGLTGYNNMRSAYGWLIARYWLDIDGLYLTKQVTETKSEAITRGDFVDWVRYHATSPDDITRALRWLRTEKYVFIDKAVTEKAQLAASEYARSRGK